MRLIAIDPYDCACNECCTGEYKPLALATDDDIADLLAGRLRDHTGIALEVAVKYLTDRDRSSRTMMVIDSVEVTLPEDLGYITYSVTWNPDPRRAGLIPA